MLAAAAAMRRVRNSNNHGDGMADSTRIVILGGGFGGRTLAQSLKKYAKRNDVEIIIIDRNNFFVFYPLLVEAGTGSIELAIVRCPFVISPVAGTVHG